MEETDFGWIRLVLIQTVKEWNGQSLDKLRIPEMHRTDVNEHGSPGGRVLGKNRSSTLQEGPSLGQRKWFDDCQTVVVTEHQREHDLRLKGFAEYF